MSEEWCEQEKKSWDRMDILLSQLKEDECPCKECGKPCKKSAERWIRGLGWQERCNSCFDAFELMESRKEYEKRRKKE